jgi:hypothetical protein
MKIKNDKKMLDKQVALWVNSADWEQFKKNSQEMMGLNFSQAISFLVKLFNRKGDLTGISNIIVEALKPVVEKELIKGAKKVAKKNSK